MDPLAEFHVADYAPPAEWTAEHVMHRMIEAFELLARCPGRVMPAQFKTGWPEYLRDQADENSRLSNLILPDGTTEQDGDREVRLRIDAEESSRRRKPPPTALEVFRMDEALAWPLACLSHRQDIALPTWAHRRATDRSAPHLVRQAQHEAQLIAAVLKRLRKVVR